MNPDQYCQEKAAASGSSFYYSFLFLPPERRRAITALYAFCREVDDAVDESSDPQLAAAKLAWWRAEVDNLFAGKPQHPVTKALAPRIESFSISQEKLNEIIDGMEMDLTQTRYLDWAGLERYCHRVAGVVGLLAAGIFGYRDPRTLEYARNLGIAFSRAKQFYEKAFRSLPPVDRRAQRPGLIMAAIYRALLDEIQRDGFHVLKTKTSLTPLRKFWIAWKTWVSA